MTAEEKMIFGIKLMKEACLEMQYCTESCPHYLDCTTKPEGWTFSKESED